MRWILLSVVQYAHDFDTFSGHLVDHDVVDDFACARNAVRAVQVRVLSYWLHGCLDQSKHAAGSWRTIVSDEADDRGKVCAC